MRFLVPWGLLGLIPAGAALVLGIRGSRRLLGRALTLTLISLALAQPELSVRESQETVFILLDRSASVGEAPVAALGELAPMLAGRGAEVGMITFGAMAQVVRPPAPLGPLVPTPGEIAHTGTDIGAAIDLALALTPPGPAQMILVSDGRATQGDPQAAAARAHGRGIPVLAFPVGQEDLVRVAELSGPAQAPPGEIVLTGAVEVAQETMLTLTLWRDGVIQHSEEAPLPPGKTRLTFADRLESPGVYVYRLEVEAPGDPVLENNALSWAMVVGEIPPVYVVGDEGSAVGELLSAAGLPWLRKEVLSPADLAGARLVILDDYPLGLIGPAVLTALRAHVAAGGGLLVIQGRQAVQGYLGSVEELLPVSYSVPERLQEATAAVVFVLDKSASMASRSRGHTKLDLLKEATAAAVEAMPPGDHVGAVAFDRDPHWLVRPAAVEEAEEPLYRALQGLTPGGGTDIYPALEGALGVLSEVEARVRHIIVVSDGKTVREGRDYAALYERVAASGIGVTAIGIGEDPSTEVLTGLSAAGGGELLLLSDVQELPRVLIRETERAVRPRFMERETMVLPGPAAGTLGFSPGSLPPLSGYTLTFPKPTAEVGLLSEAADPLLASWQVGLGRVAVLNTDLSGRWSREWLRSPGLGELWGALLGQLWPTSGPVWLSWEIEEGKLRLVAEVEEGGRWVNGLSLSGELAGEPVEFVQVAPGRYEACIPSLAAGAYLLGLSEPTGRFGGTYTLSLPYPEELSAFGADQETLREIARLSGGAIISDELLPTTAGAGRFLPLGRAFLWASAFAFLLDLALRKLLPQTKASGRQPSRGRSSVDL
jgi:Mg-chelatase subunit ChlD